MAVDKVYYYNRNGVLMLTLNEDPYYIEGGEFKDWEWSYDEQFSRFRNFKRSKTEYPFTISIIDDEIASRDKLCTVFTEDIEAGQPGYIVIRGWKLNCYVVEAERELWANALEYQVNFKIVSETSTWVRETTSTYGGIDASEADDLGRDYSEAPQDMPLKVCNYNVGGWYIGSGANVPADKDAEYYALQSSIIKNMKADILCIEEYWDVFSETGRTALSLLSKYYNYIHTENGDTRYQGRAICSKYPITNYTVNQFTTGSTRYFDHATLNVDGQIINVFVVLLDPTDSNVRAAQSAEMYSYITTNNLSNYMLVGDFNSRLSSPFSADNTAVYQRFIDAGCTIANGGDFGIIYTHSSTDDWSDPHAIDNVVYSGNFTIKSAGVDYVKTVDDIYDKIDHIPLSTGATINGHTIYVSARGYEDATGSDVNFLMNSFGEELVDSEGNALIDSQGGTAGANGYGYSIVSSYSQNITLPTDGNGFRVLFYGAVTNPEIYLDGKVVRVLTTINDGERLEVTSNGREKTIYKISSTGVKTNMFIYRDKAYSPFFSIGRNTLLTYGNVKFDFTTIEQRSEPSWN